MSNEFTDLRLGKKRTSWKFCWRQFYDSWNGGH